MAASLAALRAMGVNLEGLKGSSAAILKERL